MKSKVTLACSVCGNRNYSTHKNNSTIRLEVKSIVSIVRRIHYIVKRNRLHPLEEYK